MFDLDYIQQLIANGIEENPELEYKSAAALQRDDKKVMEITKDVSSLANSNGGILIYGIAEDQTNKHLPGKIDTVDRKVITKEWLEQILNAKIRPRIHGLKINVITIARDQVVYILEIPKGETAHQADDKKYYRRHNFTVEPLFDHEIRDIMGRQKNTDIVIDFDIAKQSNLRKGADGKPALDDKEPYFYWMNIYAENVSKIYAKYINVVFKLPKRCVRGNVYDKRYNSTEEMKADNTVRDLVEPNAERYFVGPIAKPKQYGPVRHEPLLPGMRVMLKSIPINEYSTDVGNKVSWTIYADNAEPKSGEIEFCNMKHF
ncbi:MAG: ATP-binding protein [Mucilaginibacter sp.]